MKPFLRLALCLIVLPTIDSWSWGGGGNEGSIMQEESCQSPCVPGSEDIMSQKEHGSSRKPVQSNLRWGCDWKTADRICNYNRHYAEASGYWETTSFLSDIPIGKDEVVTFYDSNSGKPLFKAPKGRSWEDFLRESRNHGWPSFRDNEVDWENVRVLSNGETVSVDGTHLGKPCRRAHRMMCCELRG
jgi:hypothetical protein